MKTDIRIEITFLCMALQLVSGQTSYTSETLTINEGLSQNTVSSIMQDKKGFIWIGTNDGLNRYDGYEFKIYKNDLHNINSLSGNSVTCIVEDNQNILWVGTSSGLSKLNLKTGQFEQKKLPPEVLSAIKNVYTTALLIDKKNNLWIGTRTGLLILSLNSNTIINFSKSAHTLSQLNDKYITSIFEDYSGRMWIGTSKAGLFSYSISSNNLEHIELPHNNHPILTITEIAPGNLIVGTYGSGLFFIEAKNGRMSCKLLYADKFSKYVRTILRQDEQQILFAAQKGIFMFNITKNIFSILDDDFKDGAPNLAFRDRSGVVWVGVNGGGIKKLIPNLKLFKTVKQDESAQNGIMFKSVRTFLVDSADRLWVAGHGGINYKSVKVTSDKWSEVKALKGLNIYALVQDPFDKNIYWVGIEGKGFNKYSFLTKKIKRLFSAPSDKIRVDEVYKILVTSTKDIYLGTERGIVKYNSNSGTSKLYYHSPLDKNSVVPGKIKALYEDVSGKIWIGSDSEGISILDPATGITKRYVNSVKPLSISANRINSFCEDSEGVMWVGTENGLNKFLPAENGFKRYTSKDGLLDDYIYGILSDGVGNLWISSNRGISRFTISKEQFSNFDVSYNLQSNEFNTVAYYKAPSGELFFGGIKGFTSFFPKDIRSSKFEPAVMITNFKKNNAEVDLGENICYGKKLDLTYLDHFFSFEIASTDFSYPARSRFRYRLEGFDNNWIYTNGFNRMAVFSNINPGHYKFRVGVANSDGMWSRKETVLDISITPALWATWWFRAISFFIVIAILFLLYYSRNKRLKIEKEIQYQLTQQLINSQEEERRNISAELHDEMGQDLIVIKNKLLLAKREGSTSSHVEESIEIITKAINDISSISHLLHPSELEQLGLSLAIEAMIQRVENSTEIKFKFDLLSLDNYFPNKEGINIFRIFQEAFNNIVKHSEATLVMINCVRSNESLRIEITDNGKGISANHNKQNKIGPHLGIAGMIKRTEMMRGKFSIKSSPNKGTKIILNFASKNKKQISTT